MSFTKKISYICVFLLGFANFCFAQKKIQEINNEKSEELVIENSFTQRISWNKAQNALEYKVVIEKLNSSFVKTFVTQKEYVDFSLEAGDYRYKIVALDFLGRESSFSEYKNFSIIKAQRPKIILQEDKVLLKNTKSFTIPVSAAQIASKCQIEVINEESKESKKASLSYKKKNKSYTLKVDKLVPGKYFFKATNPSGLSGKSDVYEIYEENNKLYIVKFREVKEEEQEKSNLVEVVGELSEKDDSKISLKKINIELAPVYSKFLYPEIITLVYDKKAMFGLECLASYLPFNVNNYSFGLELDGVFKNITNESIDTKAVFELIYFKVNGLARYNFKDNKMAVNAKLGLGLTSVGFNKTQEDDKTKTDLVRYGYLKVGCGLSYTYIPMNKMIMELGIDYDNILIPDFNIGIIQMYFGVGLRFL